MSTKLALSILTFSFLILNSFALAQEWTLEKDQLVVQPKPYSP